MHATTVIVSVAAALALHPHRHRLTLQLLITLLFTTQPHLRRLHLGGLLLVLRAPLTDPAPIAERADASMLSFSVRPTCIIISVLVCIMCTCIHAGCAEKGLLAWVSHGPTETHVGTWRALLSMREQRQPYV